MVAPVLSIGALLGEHEGDPFTGTFERKRKCISGFLFLDPEDIKKLNLGAIWNFSKGQGSSEPIADNGTQRTLL